jgi:hypothetical protein
MFNPDDPRLILDQATTALDDIDSATESAGRVLAELGEAIQGAQLTRESLVAITDPTSAATICG